MLPIVPSDVPQQDRDAKQLSAGVPDPEAEASPQERSISGMPGTSGVFRQEFTKADVV